MPSHTPWTPRPYMQRAVEHLMARGSAGLALDPGMGKTSITLEAFRQLKAAGQARTMLVIAPLRVCRIVWRQEGQKWTQFRGLRFSLLHGPKKAERLSDDADIWLINPEGVDWLCKQYAFQPLPFDIVCIDELTRFKNAGGERFKALRPKMSKVRRRWGLTGSLAPNGYMDVFGQQLMLDDGAALGRFITHFRNNYFTVGYDGWSYDLMPGAEARIITKLAPYWLQLSAEDYLQLPALVNDLRLIDLEPAAAKTYAKMKKEMIAMMPEGVVTAANAAACYSKLSQMANGAVYTEHKASVAHVHDAKLDALEELILDLNGQPLLIAYEFNHDLDRLRERFGVLDKATGKKFIPYLGAGTTTAQEAEWIERWNKNQLPFFFCHPMSAGHGLNLQEGSAGHVAWFSPIWDLELWDQFIRRVRRSGNQAQRVINHIFAVRGTIDELKLEALADKDTTQKRLLSALNKEILRDAETHAGGETQAKEVRLTMAISRLTRQGDANSAGPAPHVVNAAAASAAPLKQAPAGWPQGAVVHQNAGPAPAAPAALPKPPAGWPTPQAPLAPVADAAPTQQERIQTLIAPQPAASVYPAAIQAQAATLGANTAEAAPLPPATAEAPKRTRKAKDAPTTSAEASPFKHDVPDHVVMARISILRMVFQKDGDGPFNTESVEDGLEIARELSAFVEEG